jgi:hypothetical protein
MRVPRTTRHVPGHEVVIADVLVVGAPTLAPPAVSAPGSLRFV